jgi:hypothetical protein
VSNFEELLKGLVRTAGAAGLKELEDTLAELREEANLSSLNKAILQLAVDAIDEHGPEGLLRLQKLIDKMGDSDRPEMSFASLKARSDYLAALQNAEADDKSKAKDFFRGLGSKLAIVLKAILSGLTG